MTERPAGEARAVAAVPAQSAAALPMPGAAPVFIHSSWRTASTWLWAKMRAAPTTIAYCEVFHERLAHCTIPDLRGNDFSRWRSKHPEGAPYFLEFAPLIGKGGSVRGYDPAMAVDRFLPEARAGGALSAGERAYLQGLVDEARARGRIPVLTDTRTLGRVAAIAQALPGPQVLLVRNVFHQWASYSEQWANGNPYFLAMQLRTIEASRHDPFVALIADWFDEGEPTPLNAATFQLFLLFHLYLYLRAFDAASFVVDVNRIALDPEARTGAEAALSGYVRWPIDLSDVRLPYGMSLFSVPSKAAFVDAVDQFAKQMPDASTTPEAARFAARLKDEALAEWERAEFYGGAHRVWAGARIARAESAAAESAAALLRDAKIRARLERRIGRLEASAGKTKPRPRG